MKKQKRKVKLKGRIRCHGSVFTCWKEILLGRHKPFGKKTPKGTKPKKKIKKTYAKK